jgi:Family of unknown function (DUF6325)
MEFGPVQMLVIGFKGGKFSGEILGELRRLREFDVVRLVDLLFVARDQAGEMTTIAHSDLEEDEAKAFGALAGALLAVETEEEREPEIKTDDVWYLADAIPHGTSAGIVLLEHRWAIPLSDAVERAGGEVLVDTWIHSRDLEAAGAAAGPAG